jgi:hypothetical protein
MAAPFFTWRSGDDVADGGHMLVPSMGQSIPSPTSSAAPSIDERSGDIHIIPITWHKVKKSTRAKYCVLTRRIMGPTMLLENLLNCVTQSLATEASMSSLLDSPLPCKASVMPERLGNGSITNPM